MPEAVGCPFVDKGAAVPYHLAWALGALPLPLRGKAVAVTVRNILAVSGLLLIAGLAVWFGLARQGSLKAGVIAAPPGAYTGERVTVRYMIWGRENEVRQEREKLQIFVGKNPDVQVDLIQVGGTQYQVKLATMLAGGLAPDVFMVHEAMFPTLADNGLILPLDDLVAADSDVDLDEFFPRVVEECRYDGALYKLPVSFNTVVLFYNEDMFDEAGLGYPDETWTWKDMLDAARRLTKRDAAGGAKQYGIMNVGPWLTYCMMMWQNGGELFDEEGRLVIGKPGYIEPNVEALQFCADLQLEEKVQPTAAAIETLPANPFVAGLVAMNLGGTWVMNQIRGHQGFRWNIAHPPHGTRRATLVFGGSPVINRQTEHPEAAWRLLKAMASDWWQERLAVEVRNLPAKRSVAERLRIPGIPEEVHLEKIFEVIEYARSQPIGPEVSEWLERPIADLRDRVLLGSIGGDGIRTELEKMQRTYDERCPYCSVLH